MRSSVTVLAVHSHQVTTSVDVPWCQHLAFPHNPSTPGSMHHAAILEPWLACEAKFIRRDFFSGESSGDPLISSDEQTEVLMEAACGGESDDALHVHLPHMGE